MIRAEYTDKERVIDILTESFNDNKSVNYIIKQDRKRRQKIERLMGYSFDVCHLFGEVFLTDDKKGCALILLPDQKKPNFKSILLDVKLILRCTGLSNLAKAITRETKIKHLHPNELMYYLWFIGVDEKEQNKGIGSSLLKEVIKKGISMNRNVFLETSTTKNIPWYQKFGFKIYNELDLGYRLYFMKKE